MSLENNIGTGNQFISDKDRKRMQESEKIRELIPVIGAVVATRAILQKCHGSALTQQERVLQTFNNPDTTRDDRIGIILQTQEICAKLARKLNPRCHIDNYAFYMRRIHILSVILSNGIAEAEVASMTADLVLGKRCFDISKMEIVQEYQERKAQIREQYL